MLKLIWTQTLARRGRLAMTVVAVALGVTFVTGTLVLTDTSQRAFDAQFGQAVAGVDLTIRRAVAFDSAMGVEVQREPLSPQIRDRVAAVPGVAEAREQVNGSALITLHGTPIVPSGPSVLASWTAPPVGPYPLRTGQAPEHLGEVVIDQATARSHRLAVGDRVQLRAEATGTFTVVGLIGFGDRDGLPDSTLALVDARSARHLLQLGHGSSEVDVVAADGVAPTVLAERIQHELGNRYEVGLARDTAAASAAAAKTQVKYIALALLVLAGAALLIGAFLIANTFSIMVTQRLRELALLRAAGATGRQVFASVMGEAVVVGAVGGLLGLVAGVGAALGLRALVANLGVTVTDSSLVITGRTILVAVTVGLGVTLLAAVGPARRAARVAPVAALRESTSETAQPASRARKVVGLVAAVLAVPAVWFGAAGAGSLAVLAAGAASLIVALVLLGPACVPAVARFVGRPLTAAGVPGALARQSAARAPRRTAATVTALALSLALVVLIAVVGASIKTSMRDSYREVVSADLVVESARGEMLGGLVPAAYRTTAALAEVDVVSRIRYGHWKDPHTGTVSALTAIDPATLPEVTNLDLVSGSLDRLEGNHLDSVSDGVGGLVLSERVASQRGLTVGDQLPMRFARVGTRPLVVVGVISDSAAQALGTDFLVSLATYDQLYTERMDASLLVKVSAGSSVGAAAHDLETALSRLPPVEVRDQAAAADARTRAVDQIVGMVTALLLFSVLIAMLGIINTLALSILERTREIGLLRAVGMTRRQLRSAIRAEAILTSAVGLVVGLVLGVGFAAVALSAAGQGLGGAVSVPVGVLAMVTSIATVVGLVAGILPARRAARMEVLAAIADT